MRVFKILAVAFFSILVCAGCRAVSPEEEIYRFIVKDYPPSDSALALSGKPYVLVIEENTRTPLDDGETLAMLLDSYTRGKTVLSEETKSDFIEKNRVSSQLDPRMDLDKRYILISRQELKTIFNGPDGWDTFYETYPDALGRFSFSRVGFNKDYSQALVYDSFMMFGDAGGGGYCIYEKESGDWVLKDCFRTWKA